MIELYAEFFFPGLIVSESSTRKIASREDIGPWPDYAYSMRTFAVTVADVDGERVTGKARDYSPTTWRGRAMTLDDVKREMPNERILIENMQGNGWNRICRTATGRCFPMDKDDVAVLP